MKDYIKALRTARGMTQVQLADAIGTSPSVISGWERRGVIPSWWMCHKLSMRLKVPLEEITARRDAALRQRIVDLMLDASKDAKSVAEMLDAIAAALMDAGVRL